MFAALRARAGQRDEGWEGVRLAGLETEAPRWCVGGDRDTHPARSPLPAQGLLLSPPSGPWRGALFSFLPFLPGMAPMGCQSSAILVLLEILGMQPLVPGRALAAPSCSCCVLTSFPPIHIKKGKPKTSQNHLPPWLKVQIEGFLVLS